MKRVEFGFVMPHIVPDKSQPAEFGVGLNRALSLVTGHFHSAWMVDHLQFGEAGILEGFTALAYMAALHPQLVFGNMVLCQSFRNPGLLAKMGATLHFLSGGRFVLGLGAGWHKEEYRSYGYDFPPGRVRVEQLAEAVQIIRALWTEDLTTFEGRYYRVRGAYCAPKPAPTPIMMIGAFRPQMLRLTARYADWWNVSSTGADKYRRILDAFERACTDVGRDPSTVRRSWGGGCVCASTEAQAKELAGGRYSTEDPDDFDFVGTPQQVIEQMLPFVELGVDYFMLDCGGYPDLTTLELLVSEVLPVIAEAR